MVNLPFKDETYFVVLAVDFISIKTYPLQSLSWRLVHPVYIVVSERVQNLCRGVSETLQAAAGPHQIPPTAAHIRHLWTRAFH